jgi:hypothetical protein
MPASTITTISSISVKPCSRGVRAGVPVMVASSPG